MSHPRVQMRFPARDAGATASAPGGGGSRARRTFDAAGAAGRLHTGRRGPVRDADAAAAMWSARRVESATRTAP